MSYQPSQNVPAARYLHISENASGLAESPSSTASRAARLDEMPNCDRDAGDAYDEVT